MIRTLLTQLRLALLHGCDHHVADTGVGETVQARTGAVRLDEKERLCAAVVRAVQHGASGKTHREAEFCARGNTSYMINAMSLEPTYDESGRMRTAFRHVLKLCVKYGWRQRRHGRCVVIRGKVQLVELYSCSRHQ